MTAAQTHLLCTAGRAAISAFTENFLLALVTGFSLKFYTLSCSSPGIIQPSLSARQLLDGITGTCVRTKAV